MTDVVLISMKPDYAKRIFSGRKKYEFRRRRPAFGEKSLLIVYSSTPERSILGHFIGLEILEDKPLRLWSMVKSEAGMSLLDYRSYFCGTDFGYAIKVSEPTKWAMPLTLSRIRQRFPKFMPPQSYYYLMTKNKLLQFLANHVGKVVKWTPR